MFSTNRNALQLLLCAFMAWC